jgi:hypothetical protein
LKEPVPIPNYLKSKGSFAFTNAAYKTLDGACECFFVAFSWFYSLYSPNLIIETKAGNVPGESLKGTF